MKLLLFRAYNKETNEMFLSPYDIQHMGSWFDSHLPGALANVDNIAIMQFTGLRDKNGRGIYEGDILKSAYGANKDVVTFKNGSFCCFGEPIGFQEEDHTIVESDTGKYAIIIGNIYQNPELLP